MTQKSKTVIFFGSGPVAAACLELLVAHTPVEAIITKPIPPHHKETAPVIELAKRLGIPYATPANKLELSKLFMTKPFGAPLGIVIDFGMIIAQDVIDYFPLGIINSHFSLLPEWRGADPITFSILSGQETTGVSLMLITAGMDEGPILAYGEHTITPSTTTPELTHSLILLSDGLLREELPRQFSGESQPIDQLAAARSAGFSAEPTYSRKLTKADGVLDWSKPAAVLEREIRAFIEWPKSRTTLGTVDVVIMSAIVSEKQFGVSGVVHIEHNELYVACGKGSLQITSLKPAGKNEMPAKAFLAGYANRIQ